MFIGGAGLGYSFLPLFLSDEFIKAMTKAYLIDYFINYSTWTVYYDFISSLRFYSSALNRSQILSTLPSA